MRKKSIFVLMILSTCAMLGLSLVVRSSHATEDGKKEPQIDWLTFDQGMEVAKKKNRMLVVDFYTDWCHWCKVMDKETYGDKKVVEYAEKNVVMAKINAETNERFKFRDATYSGRELSMMFGVSGFPTTVFLNADGELITAVPGFIDSDKFVLILKYLSGNWYDKMQFNEFIKQEEEQNKS